MSTEKQTQFYRKVRTHRYEISRHQIKFLFYKSELDRFPCLRSRFSLYYFVELEYIKNTFERFLTLFGGPICGLIELSLKI